MLDFFFLKTGKGHEGVKAARVIWNEFSNETYPDLITVGFGKASQREINVYRSNNITQPISTIPINISPSIIVPYIDQDTNLMFLTGRVKYLIYLFLIFKFC